MERVSVPCCREAPAQKDPTQERQPVLFLLEGKEVWPRSLEIQIPNLLCDCRQGTLPVWAPVYLSVL